MNMPGFSALAAIQENRSTNTRTPGVNLAQVALRSLQPAQIVPAIPGPGFNPGVCYANCYEQCKAKGGNFAHCEQICDSGCEAGGGGGYPGPGSGASSTCFKNTAAGTTCCTTLFIACALACPETGPGFLGCMALCTVGTGACMNCQLWPCNSM